MWDSINNIMYFWQLKSIYIFDFLLISLLFMRRSSQYDIQAFIAVGLGVFVGEGFPNLNQPMLTSFLQGIYEHGFFFNLLGGILLLSLGARQLGEKPIIYSEVLDGVIESPIALFIFVIFLTLFNHFTIIYINIASNFKTLLLQDIVHWIFLGCIIATIKNILGSRLTKMIGFIFAIALIFFGVLMLSRLIPIFPHFY